ncbi:FAD/NAD(P)-binding domain-containing protein [Macroventuria anomochaeta]|uniref:FAD/NAD(P)-binding domain-containing protein n=1 Tax=Macroventuria anomochaeta TaxID=301207 RepID=A0ACB6RQP1_9PLEO|nr:FAD/NAD(P)-binding domain-containing protein [Macroventuria anomochaeta]KAF2624221.1 FAD/NAD(P)-binding domain-containing protein [Macroventuria anomochaeta]
MERKRIAVVGSVISGISALWTLRNAGHETPVDIGFIVLNAATYPNLIQFLKALNARTDSSEMTFAISRDAGAFEWSGTSLGAFFAQSSNIFKPSFWRMIFDTVRFNQFALDLLNGYSDAFRDNYLIPMTACIWSTGADKCALEFPALTLVRFMWNHHLLATVSERPPWLTVHRGAKHYIDAVMKECKNLQLHLSTPVKSVQRKDDRVRLTLGGPSITTEEIFDSVILACHGDQARTLLSPFATLEEPAILNAFQTTPNIAYLHSDLSFVPQRRAAWSAWNYLTTTSPSHANPSGTLQTVSLTYNMNILQHIPVENSSTAICFTNSRMIAAQERLHTIQGRNGVWFAGAWTGYGFHEDGFSSGMRVGLELGGGVPWEVKDAKFGRGLKPELDWKDWVVRAVAVFVQLWITVLERVLGIKRQSMANVGNGTVNGKAKAT